MARVAVDLPPKGGFNFDLCKRNALLQKAGALPPGARKTGTTIVGVVYKDGVCLGADTRATGGSIVCDKDSAKIKYIAPNIYCCGAGTAADTAQVTEAAHILRRHIRESLSYAASSSLCFSPLTPCPPTPAGMISSQLDLHRYATGRQSRVITALTLLKSHLFQYQGHVEAALVLGGVDVHGPHLHTIYPHGSTDTLPYATMGSGSLAAMAMFESGYKEDMTKEEAIELVASAIRAGIFNDLGSGSNVNICTITKARSQHFICSCC
eukprot:jgi/Mesen1/5248/ME000263S04356